MENNNCIRKERNEFQIDSNKKTLNTLDNSFEILSNALQLAGNRVRLKILFLLNENEQICVCDLSDILEMNISAISQHLRKLKDRKLISGERDGQTIYYRLTDKYKEIFKPFFNLIENALI
jgi:DNA-binding transcriptional ArsR family regulator